MLGSLDSSKKKKKKKNFEELLEIISRKMIESDLHFRFFLALIEIDVKELR